MFSFWGRLVILVGFSGVLCTSTSAAIVEYSGGHGDIGLAFEGGELELHYHFGVGAVLDGAAITDDVELEPGEAYVRVPDAVRLQLTGAVPFLGAVAGDNVWILPGTNPGTDEIPFLGLAAEELLDTDFSSAVLVLTGYSGPGDFALWTVDAFGTPNVFMQSNNGLDASDTYVSVVGGHDHAFWGFSEEGVYDLEFSALASGNAGFLTDVGSFKFVVGSATAVPEPGSLVVLAIAALSGVGAKYRQRRAKK